MGKTSFIFDVKYMKRIILSTIAFQILLTETFTNGLFLNSYSQSNSQALSNISTIDFPNELTKTIYQNFLLSNEEIFNQIDEFEESKHRTLRAAALKCCNVKFEEECKKKKGYEKYLNMCEFCKKKKSRFVSKIASLLEKVKEEVSDSKCVPSSDEDAKCKCGKPKKNNYKDTCDDLLYNYQCSIDFMVLKLNDLLDGELTDEVKDDLKVYMDVIDKTKKALSLIRKPKDFDGCLAIILNKNYDFKLSTDKANKYYKKINKALQSGDASEDAVSGEAEDADDGGDGGAIRPCKPPSACSVSINQIVTDIVGGRIDEAVKNFGNIRSPNISIIIERAYNFEC